MKDYIQFWWKYYHTCLSYSRTRAVYEIVIGRPLWVMGMRWRFRRARALINK